MLERFKYWLIPKWDCKCCCLNCSHYKDCLAEHKMMWRRARKIRALGKYKCNKSFVDIDIL